ncbi:MAG: DHA2 family efflux MFS transporter permease subunit, partial [Chthonomonadales bacterium]
ITSAILEVLDSTIVNVALPQMAGNLGATSEEIGWVSTGYILSNVVVLPMTAWLSGRFGRKRYLTASIFIFMIASFFCGTSSTLIQLVFWRIMQGAGGAALLSTAQATLREIFPARQQGMVQSIYVLGIIVAPTVGPTLGGWITDNYSWPWVFFVNLPLGLISAAIVYFLLEDPDYQVRHTKVDWGGIGLLAVGLGTLQYVLEEGNSEDWFESAMIVRLSIISVVSLVSLIIWEMHPRNPGPIVNFRILKNKQLSASMLLFVALGFGLYGGIFIFPLFAQNILHFTPTQTGMVLFPGGMATAASALFCGRLLSARKLKINPRYLIFSGLLMFAYSMWMLGHLTTLSGEPDTRMGLILRGFGLGLLFIPINIAALSSLKGAEVPQAAAMINLTRQLGGSFGIAVLGTYVTNRSAMHRAALSRNFYSGNPMFQDRLHAISGSLTLRGLDPVSASNGALKIIGNSVRVQASTMAFNDCFILIGLALILVSPMVFILKNSNSAPVADAGH